MYTIIIAKRGHTLPLMAGLRCKSARASPRIGYLSSLHSPERRGAGAILPGKSPVQSRIACHLHSTILLSLLSPSFLPTPYTSLTYLPSHSNSALVLSPPSLSALPLLPSYPLHFSHSSSLTLQLVPRALVLSSLPSFLFSFLTHPPSHYVSLSASPCSLRLPFSLPITLPSPTTNTSSLTLCLFLRALVFYTSPPSSIILPPPPPTSSLNLCLLINSTCSFSEEK